MKFILNDKIDNINEIISKSETLGGVYEIIITDKNKALKLNKKSLSILNDNGINLNKVYISYNKQPLLFNTIEKIIKDNKEYFTEKK